MSKQGGAATSAGSGVLIGGIGLVLAIAAGTMFLLQGDDLPTDAEVADLVEETEPVTSVDTPAPTEPVTATVEDTEAPEGDEVAETTEVEAAAEEVPEVEEAVEAAPSIDEVRLDSDGLAVVAGRAEPGAQVDVIVDGDVVASTEADASGSFAAVGIVEPSDAPRVLSLSAEGATAAVPSDDEVILAPITPTPQATVAAETESAQTSEQEETLPRQVTVEPEVQTPSQTPETSQTAASENTEGSVPSPTDETSASNASESVEESEVVAVVEETAPIAEVSQGVDVETVTDLEVVQDVDVETVTEAEVAQEVDVEAVTEDVETVTEAEVTAPAQTTTADISENVVETVAESLSEVQPQAQPDVDAIAPISEPEPAPQIALLRNTKEGVELLRSAPTPPRQIQLDTIGYTDEGVVSLAGRASVEAKEIRVYLNNRSVALLPVDQQGSWRGELPGIDPGVYTLRIDALDANGDVTSRLETPFKREEPAILAAAIRGPDGPVKAVTVQTGDTLWAIARDRYGEGVLYVRVFEANRSSIRDPDLIFPGQVFDLPDE